MDHIVVGMSGGVDSSVTALLLQQQGHTVEGLFMHNWQVESDEQHCTALQDSVDAMDVCAVLDIPFDAVDFSREYRERVFQDFLQAHQQGLTPNPDVLCNSRIKFDVFLNEALKRGADRLATGHYARIASNDHGYQLHRSADQRKDQTYFLHRLNQYQLSKACFPLGGLHKSEVRILASQAGFNNAKKKDSTGICFIGERHYRRFLQHYLPTSPGDIVDEQGSIIGQHEGLSFYTLGQRQGLGIGGSQQHSGQPWYVAGKDPQHNRLIAVQGNQHRWLYRQQLPVQDLHWIAGSMPAHDTQLTARIRHLQPDTPCCLTTDDSDTTLCHFTQPQYAPTPGQAIVFYDGPCCLGGGVIGPYQPEWMR